MANKAALGIDRKEGREGERERERAQVKEHRWRTMHGHKSSRSDLD